MPPNKEPTRNKILDAAEALVFSRGYGATSVDAVIEHARISKGTFFYHFKTKQDLAKALVERFYQRDMDIFSKLMGRARELSTDPLQQFVLFVGLLEDWTRTLPSDHPGCLFAAFLYQNESLEKQVTDACSAGLVGWRQELGAQIREISKVYSSHMPVDANTLADVFMSVLQGAFIFSRATRDPKVIASHLTHFRNYLNLLFERKGVS